MGKTFASSYVWRWGDLDPAAIAYYPSFFHYIHCFFEDWWAEGLGFDYHHICGERRLGFPVVHIDCDYRSMVRFGDRPLFRLGALKVGRSSLQVGYRLRQTEADAPLFEAKITTVCMDLDTQKSVEIPDDMRARLIEWLVDWDEI